MTDFSPIIVILLIERSSLPRRQWIHCRDPSEGLPKGLDDLRQTECDGLPHEFGTGEARRFRSLRHLPGEHRIQWQRVDGRLYIGNL